LDVNTKKVLNREKAAKGVLWAASIFTIGILVAIVGYILFRGFVSNRRAEYPVIGKGEVVNLFGAEEKTPVAVVVNRGVKKDDFTAEELRDLFSGTTKNWGFLSEQDIDVNVFTRERDSDPGRSFVESILGGGQYRRGVEPIGSDGEMVEKVGSTDGAIGFIGGENLRLLEGHSVKAVPVRFLSVVANKEVLALRNNVRLRFITEEQLKGLFTGKVDNWRKVRGLDLPVRIVSFERGSERYEAFRRLALGEGENVPDGTIFVRNDGELFEALETTPGAVGYTTFSRARDFKNQILKIERTLVKPNFTLRFLLEAPKRSGVVGGVSTIILNTLSMIVITLLFSTPIGIAAAVFLTEYAKQGRLVQVLRFGAETLAGIPSIIFGLFGFIFFVTLLKLGIGLLSGTLTLTMMILPTIVRTAEEAIKAVPLSYREGSLALGATKWQTIVRAVIPPATPGIMTGVILGIGRAVGETAALLFTMGTDYRLAKGLGASARTLSVHLYILVKEGISFDRAFGTAVILIAVILVVNFTTNKLIGRMSKMSGVEL
jgi:phosphate transport system permease protein